MKTKYAKQEREKIFFDTEFTGLHKDTTIISIGLISESGKTFYAEFTDYNKKQLNDWLKLNVIDNLILSKFPKRFHEGSCYINHEWGFSDYLIRGTKNDVAKWLKKWLNQFEGVQMWGDCISYDWVLICDLFKDSLPENVYYIPFDVCTLFAVRNEDPDITRMVFVNNNVEVNNVAHIFIRPDILMHLCPVVNLS